MRSASIRVAAVGDLHCTKNSESSLQPLFANLSDSADMLLMAGDLTDYGLPDEARVLARVLVAVLGNHDVESGKEAEVTQILTEAGVTVLDGDATEVRGVGIAGVKGFGGGFGPRTLGAWGESVVKLFVHEALNEALKLEAALARLRTPHMIALLHYAPIEGTAQGEPPEIFPFIGTGRLEEPISRYPVSFVLHGHAHRGQLEGHTKTNVPVYNVAMPLLARSFPGQPAVRIFELPSVDTLPVDHQATPVATT
jgi:Icc-related predicted phosphoesterase